MSRANPVAIPKVNIPEKAFEEQIRELCKLLGWRRYHTHRAQFSPAGFPDDVLVRRERLIFAELKAENGKVSREQQAWLDDLAHVPGVEVYVWRPSDWDQIVEVLR